MISLLEATRIPTCLRRGFVKRETWSSWFAFLAALFGEKMSDEQLAIYRQCTGREVPPRCGRDEAWLVVGRRGGKIFMLALIAAYFAAFFDYRQYLQPGERGTVLVLAATAKQARVIFRFVRGMLTEVPMLRAMSSARPPTRFDLTNGVTIEVNVGELQERARLHGGGGTVRRDCVLAAGRTAAEPDYRGSRRDPAGDEHDPERDVAVRVVRPMRRRARCSSAFRQAFWPRRRPILLWHAPTRLMNPSVPQALIDAAIERDPAHAPSRISARSFATTSKRSSSSTWWSAASRLAFGASAASGHRLQGFRDPSGGAVDSMTLAIAHREDKLVVIDKLLERKPPFSPCTVVAEFSRAWKAYRIINFVGDRYAGECPVEGFRSHAVTYEPSAKPKNDLYVSMLPLLSSQMIELLDQPRLIGQIASLERRMARAGKDSIDHPPNGHDDCANVLPAWPRC